MKKIFLTIYLAAGLTLVAAPALAAGSCCIEKAPSSDTVLSCSPLSGAACSGTAVGIDCSLEPKCSAYVQAGSSTAPMLCCRVPYNTNNCFQKTAGSDCRSDTETVTCADYPTCKHFVDEAAAKTAAEVAAANQTPAINPILPKLNIDIPNLPIQAFLNVTQSSDTVSIPFLSVYLSAAFRLGLGLAAVLAVIMIMIGGFIWLASAGDMGAIKKAKTIITGASVGMLLTLGSYVFLQIVSPDLINLKAIQIPVVGAINLDIADSYNPETDSGTPGNMNFGSSQYDDIFKKYAGCAGVDPAALKAIAAAESGLIADKTNPSGYIGLFQTKPGNCTAAFNNIGKQSQSSLCGDLTNPDNNTAAGAAMIKRSTDLISSRCPNATPADQMTMIYISHNMGYGMLQYVTANGNCDTSSMRAATIQYYVNNPKTANSYAPKYQQSCLDSGKSAAECTGGPKFDYAKRIANKYSGPVISGASQACPY